MCSKKRTYKDRVYGLLSFETSRKKAWLQIKQKCKAVNLRPPSFKNIIRIL